MTTPPDDQAEREHCEMLVKYAGIPGTPYHSAVCYALGAIRGRSAERATFVFAPQATYSNGSVIMPPAEYKERIAAAKAESWQDGYRKEEDEHRAELDGVKEQLTALQAKYAAAQRAGEGRGFQRGWDESRTRQEQLSKLETDAAGSMLLSVQQEFVALQARYTALEAAARDLVGCIEYVAAMGSWSREGSIEDIYDFAKDCRAALARKNPDQ